MKENDLEQELKEVKKLLEFMKMSRDEQDRYKRYYCDAASFAYTQKVEKQLAYDEGRAAGEKSGEERGIVIGEERGIAIGEERGEKRGIISVAKKMKEAGMAFEQIMELTSLSKE